PRRRATHAATDVPTMIPVMMNRAYQRISSGPMVNAIGLDGDVTRILFRAGDPDCIGNRRQLDLHGQPGAFAVALRPDRTAEPLDDRQTNVQPKAEPRAPLFLGVRRTAKWLEDRIQALGSHADAPIAYRQLNQ